MLLAVAATTIRAEESTSATTNLDDDDEVSEEEIPRCSSSLASLARRRTSKLLRTLAAAHTNLGAAYHREYIASAAYKSDVVFERAFDNYQEGVRVRMKAIKLDHGLLGEGEGGPDDDASSDDVSDEKDVLERIAALRSMEKKVVRRSGAFTPASPCPPSPQRLDFFQTPEDYYYSDSPLDASFLPASSGHGGPRTIDLSGREMLDDSYCSALVLFNMGTLHADAAASISDDDTKNKKKHNNKSLQYLGMASKGAPSGSPIAAEIELGLGLTHLKKKDLEEAGLHLSSALRLQRNIAAANPPAAHADRNFKLSAADTLSLLGRVHLYRGEAGGVEKAMELCREALNLRRSVVSSSSSPMIATSVYNIGIALRAAGDLDSALEHCLKFIEEEASFSSSAAAAAAVLPPSSPSPAASHHVYCPHYVVSALRVVASIHLECGRPSDALENAARALDLAAATLSTTSSHEPSSGPAIAECHHLLGRAHSDLGQYDDALRHYEAALRIIEQQRQQHRNWHVATEQDRVDSTLDWEHFATVLCEMGQAHYGHGDLDHAIKCFEEVLSVSRVLFGERDPFVTRMYTVVGNVRLERGETELAATYFANAERMGAGGLEGAASGQSGGETRHYQGHHHQPAISLEEALGVQFHPAAAAA